MTHYDLTGRQIEVGNIIAVPILIEGMPCIIIGMVDKINPKSITYRPIRDKEILLRLDGRPYLGNCEPFFDGLRITRNPNRCLILNLDVLPNNYQELIIEKVFMDEKHTIDSLQKTGDIE